MPSITFVHPDGTRETVEAAYGGSIMMAAVGTASCRRRIEGFAATCGGMLVCGCCHVLIEPGQLGLLDPMDDEEDEVLDATVAVRQPNSRLSCRIKVTHKIGGLIVHLPDRPDGAHPPLR